ncbi:MAG TPA: hypothetical protein VF503_01250 [Sphingobium sp.]|uniref:LexA family protein n=1 Tax=Sphingobium sp. TaxID=1912891 RepID=UPI002ED4B215
MGIAVNPLTLSPTMVSRKHQVLAFIEQYYAVHGIGPSLSEMANAVGTNKPRVADLIRRLEREGRLHRIPGRARGVWPIAAHEAAIQLLRQRGFVVDIDILTVAPPPPVTNEKLPLVPVLDHIPDDERDTDIGAEQARGAQGA